MKWDVQKNVFNIRNFAVFGGHFELSLLYDQLTDIAIVGVAVPQDPAVHGHAVYFIGGFYADYVVHAPICCAE
jgi:hypothetical protein